jgi:hypothetical protein
VPAGLAAGHAGVWRGLFAEGGGQGVEELCPGEHAGDQPPQAVFVVGDEDGLARGQGRRGGVLGGGPLLTCTATSQPPTSPSLGHSEPHMPGK